MTNYNDGDWHGWQGGECPVHPKTGIVVKWRDGIEAPETEAGVFAKSHWQDAAIVAFRVVKEHREPREFWISEGALMAYGHPVEIQGLIRVREVLE